MFASLKSFVAHGWFCEAVLMPAVDHPQKLRGWPFRVEWFRQVVALPPTPWLPRYVWCF